MATKEIDRVSIERRIAAREPGWREARGDLEAADRYLELANLAEKHGRDYTRRGERARSLGSKVDPSYWQYYFDCAEGNRRRAAEYRERAVESVQHADEMVAGKWIDERRQKRQVSS